MLFMKSTLALFNKNKRIFSICFIMPPAEKPFGHQEVGSFYKTEHQSIMNFKCLEVLSSLRLLFLENSLTQFFLQICGLYWKRGTEGKMLCNFTLQTSHLFFINVEYLYTVKPCFTDTCLYGQLSLSIGKEILMFSLTLLQEINDALH